MNQNFDQNLKKLVLQSKHLSLGAKMVPFAGWEMPIQYEGLIAEHTAVRERAGIFDVSHMGEIMVTGSNAISELDKISSTSLLSLANNSIRYSILTREDGTAIDDVLFYKYSNEKVLIIVNASNIEKDFNYFKSMGCLKSQTIRDISPAYAELALQGPLAEKIMVEAGIAVAASLKFFTFIDDVDTKVGKLMISRTGYTGEDGFEIYCAPENAEGLINLLLSVGESYGLKPCGLGARDTLRFEVALPLYGNELTDEITPVEAGLSFFVETENRSFPGSTLLALQKKGEIDRKLVGFEMTAPGIPRHGYKVYDQEHFEIGFVTTGYYSPTLKKAVGHAILKTKYTTIGTKIFIEIRGKKIEALTCPKRFISKNYK